MDVSEEEFSSDSGSDSEGSSVEGMVLDHMLSEMLADMYDDDLEDELDTFIAASFSSPIDAFQSRTNQLLDQISAQQSEYESNVFNTMKVLNNLSAVKMWSPLYLASMAHIQAHVTHRKAFLAFPDPEDKVCYLEHKTGKKRDE